MSKVFNDIEEFSNNEKLEKMEEIAKKMRKLIELENYDEAIGHYNKISNEMPKDPEINLFKSIIYTGLGKKQESMKYIDKAIKYSELDLRWFCMHIKGLLLLHSHMHAKAMEWADVMLRNDMDKSIAYYLKAQTLHEIYEDTEDEKLVKDALYYYDKSLKEDPDSDVLESKGLLLYNLERLDEAIECFDEAISLDPENLDVVTTKASILLDNDRQDEAIECFRLLIRLNPQEPDIQYELACGLYDVGLLDEALHALNAAIKLDSSFVDSENLRRDISLKLESR